ncbi:hypothetical protein PQJ75_28285 [Rhodoplanes sp. TEM]|uniref:Lipoprotein n=1 Tax=Rhodoplanes tepidamans TaxID=200616 RepID=A0ABT5JHG9_RHOTP|nr:MULTISPECIES: hypothetical protein [Rhodoplanes]MDC7789145.1 hypothetical protein [Rhodoplanes tepidamans]MDC7987651.1 hypothetical protein [Rhodoplanes sp. TEM]MDQ0358515.1 hypothetical protein [Rhodoplanes tepidamans]
MQGLPTRRLATSPARQGGRGRIGAILLALGCAACTQTAGQTPGPVAAARTPTVAFESIDGPPESVFNHMVQSLTSEAQARQLAVVSRQTPAHYRVRVYTATIVAPKKSVVSWVWDVYDADQRRVFRLSGEEPVSGAGSTTWAAADEQVIRRMASSGMERLAGFMAAPRTAPAPAAAPSGTPAPAPDATPPADGSMAVAAYDASTP